MKARVIVAPCPVCKVALTVEVDMAAGVGTATDTVHEALRAHNVERHPEVLPEFDAAWADLPKAGG